MNTIEKTIRSTLTVLGYILGWMFGGFDMLICTLLVFVSIDYATGVAKAYYVKSISSNVGFKGLLKKIMIFAIVAVANIIDKNLTGDGTALRTMTLLFYISNEGISILENVSQFGIPLPAKLKELVSHFSDKDDKQ